MTDSSQSHNLAAIRDLLLAAFTADELRRLFHYSRNPDLQPLVHEFGPNDSPATLVDKAIDYCQNRVLVPALLDEVRRANPGQYAHFESRLDSVTPRLAGPAYEENRRRYLGALGERYGILHTHAFTALAHDERVGTAPQFRLLGKDGVYVPLTFDAPAARQGAWTEEDAARLQEMAREETAPLELAQVLALPGHLAIVGDAGCGKTTLLHVLVTALAAEDATALAGEALAEALPHPHPLPVLLPLRLFEHACGKGQYDRCVADLLRFVDDWFAEWCPDADLPDGFLANHLRAGRAWFLLDALDEVADPGHRRTVRNVIQELAHGLGDTRLVITARVAGYRGARLDDRFTVIHVRDLDDGQRTDMIRAIYDGLGLVNAERKAADLAARFSDSETLGELGRTPVMVWTASVIHALQGELPESRAALYDGYIDILLKHSFKRSHYDTEAVEELSSGLGWSLPERRHYLNYAAFQVHRLLESIAERRGTRRPVVGEDELADQILASYFQENLMIKPHEARQRAREFLGLMVAHSGLIYETSQGYTVGDHLTMQEFLAGCYLGDGYQWEDAAGYHAFLAEKVGDSWWHEVFVLAAGYLAGQPGFAARNFLMQIAGQGQDAGEELVALALAARCLLQLRVRRQRPAWYAGLARQLAGGLYERLYAQPASAPPAVRQESALAVGLLYGYPGGESGLDDPRFVHPAGLPAFVPIEAGPFWMGSDESPEEDERPCHRVTLDAYELARFPTTNAMFARFLEAGGYEDPAWWDAAIGDDRWADGFVQDYRGKRNRPAYWDDPRFNNPSQPVVGVTWYEAVAYCEWLTGTLNDGCTYRLPTEAEWERAARGSSSDMQTKRDEGEQGCHYPWGDDWREDHCNSEEAGLGTTSPVGIFPQGTVEGGLQDMVGNVYEWCQDWYAKDYYDDSQEAHNPMGAEQGDFRVLRGGTWTSKGPKYCRCGCRLRCLPRLWNLDGGFRCARTSSS